jgi:hypothetical protein
VSLKRLLNMAEEATHASLKKTCERHEAHVYSKVRVADVLPIEHSGIAREHYDYALRAHFDFVVSDIDHVPLFAVEFDGPSHDDEDQKARDAKKDWLVQRFELPMLRITARYLGERYRNIDLLTWFVEAWFAKQWFDTEQAANRISYEEVFSPLFMEWLPGFDKQFPLWISAPVIGRVKKLFFDGKVKDFLPHHRTSQGDDGTHYGFAWLFITEDTGVCTELAMRYQNFPIALWETVGELVVFELGKAIRLALDDPSLALTREEIRARMEAFNARGRPFAGHYGDLP